MKRTVPSEWKNYWGSSGKLKLDIEKFGKENFKREIIGLCETIGVVNYLEVHLQFKYGVLFSDEWHNDNINGKWYKELVSTYKNKMLLSENIKLI